MGLFKRERRGCIAFGPFRSRVLAGALESQLIMGALTQGVYEELYCVITEYPGIIAPLSGFQTGYIRL